MKDFYMVPEGNSKREAILETIKPICEAFGVENYDYVVDRSKGIERLVIEGQAIGCMCNSIGAVVNELITYLFVEYTVDKYHYISDKVIKNLTRYWIGDRNV